MASLLSLRRLYICALVVLVYLLLITHVYFLRSSPTARSEPVIPSCPQSVDERLCAIASCSRHAQTNTIIWTHNGTGIIKYLQWILTRKLANIRLTQLNDTCCITQENYIASNPTDQTFVQIYIIPLSVNLGNQSACALKLSITAKVNADRIQHLYFKRKSVTAMVVFEQLDLMKTISGLNISAFQARVVKAAETIKSFPSIFLGNTTTKWKTIDSEELIHSNLTDCERSLTDFLSLFKPKATTKDIIEYDSHRFTDDATWWDRSDVAERLMNNSIPPRPSKFTYTDDFYHLHGNRSFVQYLSDNRQCAKDGTFAQLHSETLAKRISNDKIDRCSSNAFDCAFSDIYSFSDREQLYEQTPYRPLKCGFTVPSIFDKVRQRYGRKHHCETVIMTSIINCYDPLPVTDFEMLPSFCLVALVDNKTAKSLRTRFPTDHKKYWHLVVLGENASLFSFPAKTVETMKAIGQRMFPLAKWIVWLDGKAHLMNLASIIVNTRVSVMAAKHSERDRTSAIEVNYTIERIRDREGSLSPSFQRSVMDIQRQEKEYQRDGFYSRSDQMNLRMYDIALLMHRNNHPCNFRFFCGWHNEINYFAYRGQLSVYYAAVRLNITPHLGIIPRSHYHTYAHNRVC